jgi:hypothetical protein
LAAKGYQRRDPRQCVGERHDDDITVGAPQRRLVNGPSDVSRWAIEGSAARAVGQQLARFIAPPANYLPPVVN